MREAEAARARGSTDPDEISAPSWYVGDELLALLWCVPEFSARVDEYFARRWESWERGLLEAALHRRGLRPNSTPRRRYGHDLAGCVCISFCYFSPSAPGAMPHARPRFGAVTFELGFVERKENVVFLGPPGVGKSHLAISLAIAAAESGRRVYYGSLAELIRSLEDAQAAGKRSWSWTRSGTCRSAAPAPCSFSS